MKKWVEPARKQSQCDMLEVTSTYSTPYEYYEAKENGIIPRNMETSILK